VVLTGTHVSSDALAVAWKLREESIAGSPFEDSPSTTGVNAGLNVAFESRYDGGWAAADQTAKARRKRRSRH